MERRLAFRSPVGRALLPLLVSALLAASTGVVSAGPGLVPGTGASRLVTELRLAAPHRNVVFTGNLASDFGSTPVYVNTNTSAWGATNNLSALYAAQNSTDLFLGVQEVISGNSLLLFVGSSSPGGLGTYNLAGLNGWGRDLTFTSATLDLFGAYFSGTNTGVSGVGAWQVLSPTSDSNATESDRPINSTSLLVGANDSVEIALPLSSLFPVNSQSTGSVWVSAFVVGGSGAWVGTGIPYPQAGTYNDGGSLSTFLVSDPIDLSLSGLPTSAPAPINVAIVFNDHQPVYEVAGQDVYNLPWTEAHATAEYIEQAEILDQYPDVNITYELSGSLLWQLHNISTDPEFNDSWIEGAWIPYANLSAPANATLLANLTGDWFSIPGYVFDFSEPAAQEYQRLDSLWSSGGTLSESEYEDAKVLWFLYEISTDLVEGRLGTSWMDPTIWALHNQTSFDQANLRTILQYSQWLTGEVIPAFAHLREGNPSGPGNVELFTSPFYHPLTPLLLSPSLSGPSGSLSKGVYTSDVLAQMNLSRDQFDQLFGAYPSGLYASEAAVSEAMVPLIQESGAQWTVTDEWTLQQSGVPALDYGSSGSTVSSMEDLYTPYVVDGANGTSTTMFFRDATLSNDWAFNYGDEPTATAVSDILGYLKGIDTTVPVGDHSRTLVTLMLDGENWQFLSPFADDGIPFLEQLYAGLEANASYVHTETPSQFLAGARASDLELPVLSSVATGSWNQGSGSAAPLQSNPSLTQWSGYTTQDWMWVALNEVRGQVVSFQQAHGLVQLQNLTTFDQNLSADTWEGNVTRAWYAIYNAEGSDWFFQMAPWTISGANTPVFNATFQGDLAYALSQLHAPIGPTVTLRANATLVRVGDPVTLNATASGGSLPYAYAWSLNGTNTSSTGASWSGSFAHPGNYTFQVWVTDGGANVVGSAPVTIEVLPAILPPVSVGLVASGSSFDDGSTLFLNASAAGGDGGFTFSWRLNGTLDPALGSDAEADLVLSGPGSWSIDVEATDAAGSTSTSPTVTVTVESPLLAAMAANATSLTVGEPATLLLSVSGGTPPYTETLELNGTPLASPGAGPPWTWSADHGGSYTLSAFVSDADRRSVASSVVIVVRSVPATVTPPSTSGSTGPPISLLEALGAILVVGAAVAVVFVLVRRRPREPSPSAAPDGGVRTSSETKNT